MVRRVVARCCVASLCPARRPPQSVAACLSIVAGRILSSHGHASRRETIYGASVRAAAERAAEARKEADKLAVEAWNKRMLGFQGPAQPSPDAGRCDQRRVFSFLEVMCNGCQQVLGSIHLTTVRRPKATPVHELERRMRCFDNARMPVVVPYKRSHLVALRAVQDLSATDPPSNWWAGER